MKRRADLRTKSGSPRVEGIRRRRGREVVNLPHQSGGHYRLSCGNLNLASRRRRVEVRERRRGVVVRLCGKHVAKEKEEESGEGGEEEEAELSQDRREDRR